MITNGKMLQNAHKVTFLMEVYPEHTMNQIIALLQMPAIDINTAIWAATEKGFISEPDAETKLSKVLKKPLEWDFGTDIENLKASMLYSFSQLAKKEVDLEENYLSSWTSGYPSHDIVIATQQLIKEHKLAKYEVEDEDNVYVFFTLYENSKQEWGRKQFKKPPKPSKTLKVKS